MDRSTKKRKRSWLVLVSMVSFTGCAANPVPTATVWDKLGITGASAQLRDSLVNRNGNFPGLEKKPPVLKLADPANLAAEKPEVIKTAAKIKQDQDLKKQKLKAIKFLAEVNCGCYNKDDAVAKAFLEALNDCDPDVRKAAVEAICQTAGSCTQCRSGCETTCCTEDILKKLNDLAHGKTDQGCPKEPDASIRSLAAAAARKCPCPPPKPVEELPAPESIEELAVPPESDDFVPEPNLGPKRDFVPEPNLGGQGTGGVSGNKAKANAVQPISFQVTNDGIVYDQFGNGDEPVRVAVRKGKNGETINSIVNPSQLVHVKVLSSKPHLGEVLLELPDVYDLKSGDTLVVVDGQGNHQVGSITDASGRRLLLGFDSNLALQTAAGGNVRIGLIRQ
ncbi:MAG: HEAT repeat domain-containing protein [Pirellula sp.]|nr:HEAT repeat domain-containing protein [Pirellula sp.]